MSPTSASNILILWAVRSTGHGEGTDLRWMAVEPSCWGCPSVAADWSARGPGAKCTRLRSIRLIRWYWWAKRIGQVFLLLATCKATTSPPAVHLCRLVLFIAFHIRIDFLITDPLSDLKISEQDALKRTAEGLRVWEALTLPHHFSWESLSSTPAQVDWPGVLMSVLLGDCGEFALNNP